MLGWRCEVVFDVDLISAGEHISVEGFEEIDMLRSNIQCSVSFSVLGRSWISMPLDFLSPISVGSVRTLCGFDGLGLTFFHKSREVHASNAGYYMRSVTKSKLR